MYSLSRLVEKFGRSRRVEEASSVTHKLSFAVERRSRILLLQSQVRTATASQS